MVYAKFTPALTNVTSSKVTQWDYGRTLRIEGLKLPTAVRIDIGISGQQTTISRIGTTKDGVTDVVIPDSLLEQSKNLVAYVYVNDTTEGKTVRTINIPVEARAKPEEFDSPESKELFAEAIELINGVAVRAENAESSAKTHADSAKESLESTQKIAGSFDETSTKAVKDVNDAGTLQIQAINNTKTEALEAVQSEGAAQVKAIQDEGASQLEQIQVAGENIVEASAIAEQNAKNVLANAIKGHLKGEIVTADDVSPVEYDMNVKACGKNHFDVSKIESSDKITNNGDGSVTVAAGSYGTNTKKTLHELCPTLEEGKAYVLSLTTQSALAKYIYLTKTAMTWGNGKCFVMTREMLDSYVNIYGMHSAEEGFGQECIVSNIQIEEGTTPTEYTPYIDPATVTVRRCGKNLIPFPYPLLTGTKTQSGLTFTVQDDGGIVIDGTATADVYINIFRFRLSSESVFPWSKHGIISNNTHENKVRCVYDAGNRYTSIFAAQGTICENITFYPQIEVGTVATEYEKGIPLESFTPASDGSVSGMMSTAPNMTILTDTEGVVVECEYNKDTNKVIQKLADALGVTI